MANHVATSVTFNGLTPESVKRLNEKFDKIDFGDTVGDFFYEDLCDDRDKFIEFVGSKWCNLEDKDFDAESGYAYFSTTSAWSYPQEFVQNVNNFIAEEQEEGFNCQVIYEDEMPNFAGGQLYIDGELEDYHEEEWSEILEGIKDFDTEAYELMLKEEEGEDLTQEEEDKLCEIRWEAIAESIELATQHLFEGL